MESVDDLSTPADIIKTSRKHNNYTIKARPSDSTLSCQEQGELGGGGGWEERGESGFEKRRGHADAGKRKTEKDRGEGGFMVRVETEKKRQRAREKRRSGRETDEKRRFQAERVDGGLRQEEGGKMM